MIDHITEMWIRHNAAEPEEANPNAPWDMQEEQAKTHRQWAEMKDGIELLLSRALLKQHLEGAGE